MKGSLTMTYILIIFLFTGLNQKSSTHDPPNLKLGIESKIKAGPGYIPFAKVSKKTKICIHIHIHMHMGELSFFSSPGQLNKWPCRAVSKWTNLELSASSENTAELSKTCDLSESWPEGWGDMAWPTRRQRQRLEVSDHRYRNRDIRD